MAVLPGAKPPLQRPDRRFFLWSLVSLGFGSRIPKPEEQSEQGYRFFLLSKQVGSYGEAELCRLLLEISLLDSAYQRSATGRADVLMDVAKRYRVGKEKVQKTVAQEMTAKREKKDTKARTRSKVSA